MVSRNFQSITAINLQICLNLIEENYFVRTSAVLELSKLKEIDLEGVGDILATEISNLIWHMSEIIVNLERDTVLLIRQILALSENYSFNALFDQYLGEDSLSYQMNLVSDL